MVDDEETSTGHSGEAFHKTTKKAAPKKSAKTKGTKKRKVRQPTMRLVKAPTEITDLLSEPLPTSKPLPEGADPGIIAKVDGAMRSLGKLESEIIAALFPAMGGSPETMDAIATRLGMSEEEVKNIVDSALRGLRGTRGPGTRISTVWN